jgi:microcystin-dependent protein
MTSLLPTPEPPDPVEGALGHFEHSNWVKASLKALDEGTVHSNGGVATGTLLADQVTIDNPEDQTARLNLKGNSSRSILGKTSADLSRWELVLGDGTAEGGTDSGSLFKLLAYADAGSLKHTVLKADRNTGLLEVVGSPTTAKGVATKEYVDLQLPIGAIIAYGGTTVPTGWHLCDGSTHGSAALQSVLGSTATPDLRGRFIVAAGDSTHGDVPTIYNRGDIGGKERVTLQTSEMPSHNHGGITHWQNQAHSHQINQHIPIYITNYNEGLVGGLFNMYAPDGASSGSTGGDNSNHAHGINAEGGGASHENRPPYYALVYIIKKA